ncbi:Terminase, ATPase subunit [Escherichia coli]|nr:Terminase, ATPase subunit [Escherichia coli]
MVAVMGAVKQSAVFVPTTTQTAGGEAFIKAVGLCHEHHTTPADLDPRRQAMLLYFQGYRVARIAEMLGEKLQPFTAGKTRQVG